MTTPADTATLLKTLRDEAEEGRAEYAKDPRFAKLLPLIEPFSTETVVMMLMDCEDGLAALEDHAVRLETALREIAGDGYCREFTEPDSCLSMGLTRRCDSCLARAALADTGDEQ